MCRRRGLKNNEDKSKVMVLGGVERLECKIRVDGVQLEQVSNIWGEFWMTQYRCCLMP